jgi:hypothetical protein
MAAAGKRSYVGRRRPQPPAEARRTGCGDVDEDTGTSPGASAIFMKQVGSPRMREA